MSKEQCKLCKKTFSKAGNLLRNIKPTNKKMGTYSVCLMCLESISSAIKIKKRTGYRLEQKEKIVGGKDFKTPGIIVPSEIARSVEKYVVGQDQAKKKLAVAISNHYARVENNLKNASKLDKTNILLLGPSGTGKTLLVRSIAKFLNVPFVECDATGLTQAGYAGADPDSMLVSLLHASEMDISKAEKGIIFLDEFDKMAKKTKGNGDSRDVGGEGVQQAILKMVEGTEVCLYPIFGKANPAELQIFYSFFQAPLLG